MPADRSELLRLRLTASGAVQGVGFRPFVYRLATELGLSGLVRNGAAGAIIEVQGLAETVEQLVGRVQSELPPSARLAALSRVQLAPFPETGFRIEASVGDGAPRAEILPDHACCSACFEEMRDSANRRYRYPFISCTQCGPRWSLVEALPYDRVNTTMKTFALCVECDREYRDPADRRFHHQSNACPACGPRLSLLGRDRKEIAASERVLSEAVRRLADGEIVALKGVAGYQLLVDAGNELAVTELRRRKQRPAKALAVLCRDRAQAENLCELTETEHALLNSPAAPIVLLRRRDALRELAEPVAPGTPYLGLMLPASPLHWLLCEAFGRPLVATSGNRSGEAICSDDAEAFECLSDIADCFLIHDRAIARPLDDSVAQIALGRPMLLRRARGYAPAPLPLGALEQPEQEPALAVGAYLKSTVALQLDREVLLSAYIGDLGEQRTRRNFEQRIDDLCRVFRRRPALIAHDTHPDYPSTQYAVNGSTALCPVQHHHAHIAACLAEHGLDGPVLGIAWDGVGLGDDGGAWGGELMLADRSSCVRRAALLPLALPGGDRAAMDLRLAALAALWTLHQGAADAYRDHPLLRQFSEEERRVYQTTLQRGVNLVRSSSAGRLFDAVAALLDVCRYNRHEGEAAMQLQFAAESVLPLNDGAAQPGDGMTALPDSVALPLVHDGSLDYLDWRPLLARIDDLRSRGRPVAELAALFHRSLAGAIVDYCHRFGHRDVVLSGGCFQNRLLLALTARSLRDDGVRVYWPQRVPPNDGGIAYGQLVVACGRRRQQSSRSQREMG